MDIDTPSSPPPGHHTSPSPQPITPATPLLQQAAPLCSPDLLNSVHAPSVHHALQPKSKAAKRTSHQIGSNTPTSQPLRLRPTPNQDSAKKLEEARTLLEEIYHIQGIDKQETGLALIAINNIRRSFGYPHLGSSRDPWNSAAHQQPPTTAIQTELNSLRQDLDQKFSTLANLLTSNSNHTGPTYVAALMQNVTTQQPTLPCGNNNNKSNKKRPLTKEKDALPSNTASFNER